MRSFTEKIKSDKQMILEAYVNDTWKANHYTSYILIQKKMEGRK